MTALLLSALASACLADELPDGTPVDLSPMPIACATASDCANRLVDGKRAYASLSEVDATGLSPISTNENYSNSPYRSDPSTPVSCASGPCSATISWPQQVPSGRYFLFVFIDTNGDALPTKPRIENGTVIVRGEPSVTMSPVTISTSTTLEASGSLWADLDPNNNFAR